MIINPYTLRPYPIANLTYFLLTSETHNMLNYFLITHFYGYQPLISLLINNNSMRSTVAQVGVALSDVTAPDLRLAELQVLLLQGFFFHLPNILFIS